MHVEPAAADLIEDDAWAAWSGNAIDGLQGTNSILLLTAPLDRRQHLAAALIPNRFAELAKRIVGGEIRDGMEVVVDRPDGNAKLTFQVEMAQAA